MQIVGVTGFRGLWAFNVANFFLGQSIGIDENNWRGKLFFRSIDRYWWEQTVSVKIFILASKL